MNKKIIALSMVAAIATSGYANDNSDMAAQLEMLKKQIATLEAKLNSNTKTITKNAKTIKKTVKKVNVVKAHDAGDNIKWDVDFRTSVDKINYKHADGSKSGNDALMTNRLLLGMKYQADDKVTFYGTLGYNKAYGDTANHSQSNTKPGYADFDWVTNENATDNSLKVKEAYWLYMNDTFFGTDVAWTASVGRRPSTGGLGINFREGDKRKSALSHTVNVEFDGASLKWNLDKVTPMTGSWFKLCMGRGLTNAKARFQNDGSSYASDENMHSDVDMIGFIFVPYDDGQYSVHTNYAKAVNLIGFTNTELAKGNPACPTYGQKMVFQDTGDITLATAMLKVDGIGNEINDFLDDTTFFASYAQSKTSPNATSKAGQGGMLGSNDSETGNSVWLGVQMPCLLTDDGRFGIEWNKGSKYWRSFTYAEDTMSGSKIATRGTAWEIYWQKPLTKALSMDVRYTMIDYDYTGSQAFFGADGTPMTMAQAQARGQNPVKESTDLRIAMRYRF